MYLKNGKVFTSKFVGTGPSSYEKESTKPLSHKGCKTKVYTTSLSPLSNSTASIIHFRCEALTLFSFKSLCK